MTNLVLNAKIMLRTVLIYIYYLFFYLLGAGVYYLAEFVEEHTALTKKVIKWTIHVSLNI